MSDVSLQEIQKEWHGSKKSYLIGFIASLLLTGISYYFVWSRSLSPVFLVYLVFGLSLIQAFVQVFYFLHVGEEPKPHWQTGFFLFMILILFMVVVGTVWIMKDLDNRMMIEMTTTRSSTMGEQPK